MVNEAKNLGGTVVDRETEQGFTPPPWKITPSGFFEGVCIRTEDDQWIAQVWSQHDGIELPRDANARLVAAAPSLATFLMKIYLDYEDDCNCECNSEECCSVLGEKCAKCHANVALLLLDQPADESAKRPISNLENDGQASSKGSKSE